MSYEASLHSSCRARITRAVVEDGLSSGNESENEEIIEVDVGFRDDDCYLIGSKIKQCSILTKRQDEVSPGPKLFACEENKENMHSPPSSENGASNILNWSNAEELIQKIQDESKAQCNNTGEPNPTLMLMKKQISEIEKEIQLRASQQSQKSHLNGTATLVDTEIDMINKSEVTDISPTNSCVSMSNRLNGRTVRIDTKNPISTMEMDPSEQDSLPMNHDPELDSLDPIRKYHAPNK